MRQRQSILTRGYSYKDFHLTLGTFEGKLCLCDWTDSVKFDAGLRKLSRELKAVLQDEDPDNPNEILERASAQLDQYFSGERREFDMPLLIVGSEFHGKAMNFLRTIGYGDVITYGEFANVIGDGRTMSQMVGSCVGSNLLSIFIPCHRVVATTKGNGGYRGGLPAKEALLSMERQLSCEKI